MSGPSRTGSHTKSTGEESTNGLDGLRPDLPKVTVVMPVRNEGDFIARALTAVLEQDYPHELLEVLVVDGMSDDNTREIVGQFQDRPVPIQLVENSGRIVPTGLNRALPRANGEVVVRVDGHCEIASDYVSLAVHHLAASDVAGVGGPIETVASGSIGEAIALAMSSWFGVGGSAFRTGRKRPTFVDSVAFPAYTRAALESAGPFDEELMRNQDDEYNYRLRGMGEQLLLHPDIRSKYYARTSYRKLARQYYQYGVYKVRVLQKHPAQMKARQFAPPLLALTTLVATAALPFSIVPLIAVLGAWSTLMIAATVKAAAKHGAKYLVLLPPAFLLLHFGYGFGFLRGLLLFARRWGDRPTYPEVAA